MTAFKAIMMIVAGGTIVIILIFVLGTIIGALKIWSERFPEFEGIKRWFKIEHRGPDGVWRHSLLGGRHTRFETYFQASIELKKGGLFDITNTEYRIVCVTEEICYDGHPLVDEEEYRGREKEKQASIRFPERRCRR